MVGQTRGAASARLARRIDRSDTDTSVTPIAPSIFKAYDIRGIVDRTLTEAAARAIGAAFGAEARARGVTEVAVGRDGRLSGPRLAAALIDGIRCAGVAVADIGMAATPMVYFAGFHLGSRSGIAITGSHNPPEYNGMKLTLAGDPVYGEALQALRRRIEANDVPTAAAPGALRAVDVADAYVARIAGDVKLARPMTIAIDCGNGVAGAIAPRLYRALGCQVIELFCDVDGNFPNHHPDPAHPENLQDLIRCLRDSDAELGLAFDGDGDRLGVVTQGGDIIWPDRQMILFARGVLAERPGAEIVFDVKCSRHLAAQIRAAGGKPTMWRTGHSLIKAKLKESGAPLAGEMSGHIFFNDRWYGFDDALYAGARLLELLAREPDPSAALRALPNATATPELHLHTAEGENFTLVERLKTEARFDGAREVITIDGVRVEYEDGFGLARPSNTTPVVVLRFEADSPAALARIQADFRRALRAVKADASLPF